LNWRKSKEVIHFGKTLHYVPENDVYVYFRIHETERVMIIINNHLEQQTLDLNRFSEGIRGHSRTKEILTNKTINLEKNLTVSGETALILELN